MSLIKQKKEYYTNLFEHVMLNTDRVILINGAQKERNLVLSPFLRTDNKHSHKVIIKCSRELIKENIIDQILIGILPNYYRGLDFKSKYKIFENVIEDFAEKNTKLYLFIENIETLKKVCQDLLLKTIININKEVLHLIIESEPDVELMGLVDDYDLSSRLFYYELENFAEVNNVTELNHLSKQASNDEYIMDDVGNERYQQRISRYAAAFILLMLMVPLVNNFNFPELILNEEQANVAVSIIPENMPVVARLADETKTEVVQEEAAPTIEEMLDDPIFSPLVEIIEEPVDQGYSFIENTLADGEFSVYQIENQNIDKILDNTFSALGIDYSD